MSDKWPDDHMLEAAWVLIANAWDGNWLSAPEDWREAAIRWRGAYHRYLEGDHPSLDEHADEAIAVTREREP